MTNLLAVFVGGGAGCLLRHAVGIAIGPHAFPYATFAANVAGCLLIGCFGGLAERYRLGEPVRLLLTTGLCGGFTTFSTFSRECVAMLQSGRVAAFLLYAIGSVVAGIIAAAVGYALLRSR